MSRNFDVNVKTVGVLDAVRSHMVSSEVKGDKAKIIFLVKDGTRIATGDDLVKLDPTPFEDLVHRLKTEAQSLQSAADATEQMLEWEKNQVERELKAAQFDIEVANLEFDRLVKGDGPIQLAQLTAEAEKAREEWSRYDSYIKALEDLAKKGVKNPSEMGLAREKVAELKEKFESANRAFHSYRDHVLPSLIETARAKVERSRMELEQTRKGSVFKVAKAISNHQELKGKLQMAQSALQEAQGELGKTVIRAPFDGIAILYEAFRDGQQRKPRIGDLAWQNQPLLYLPDISSMIVKTQIREIDLYKIAVGQSCTVQVDAYPDQLFDGEISFIGALAEERVDVGGGEKYFQVTVLVKTEDTRLRPGMTARVTTLTDQIENALCVPIQTIFDEAGIKYCYRFSGEVFQKVKVLPGRQNENMVEIMSGLKEGEQVSLIKPPEEKIKTSLPSQ
jgi:HlyD family secretion protein